MLNSKCIEEAPALTAHFKKVQAVHAPFVPSKVRAIITLGEYPVGSLDDPPLELNLTLEEKITFMETVLYQDWAEKHYVGKVVNLSKAQLSDAEKFAHARKLYGEKGKGGDGGVTDVQMELELVVTALGPAGQAEKIKYLFADRTRFALLGKWSPANGLHKVEPVAMEKPTCSAGGFVDAVEVYVDAAGGTDQEDAVKNFVERCPPSKWCRQEFGRALHGHASRAALCR